MTTAMAGEQDDAPEATPAQATERSSRAEAMIFSCPHCQQPIQVAVRTEILGLRIPGEEGAFDPLYGLTVPQLEVIKTVKESGVFSSFVQVVKMTHAANLPKSMEGFFLTFLRTAKPKKIPHFMLGYFVKQFRPARVNYFVAQGIGVVLADGVMKVFLPMSLINGNGLQLPGGGLRFMPGLEAGGFADWIKTRFGWVVGKGALFEAMQVKSHGEFGRG